MINRLRNVLTGVFPALGRAFDHSSHRGALVLLIGYQRPAHRSVRGADTVAATALEAAQAGGPSHRAKEVGRLFDRRLRSVT